MLLGTLLAVILLSIVLSFNRKDREIDQKQLLEMEKLNSYNRMMGV